jgi:hypothetical protein
MSVLMLTLQLSIFLKSLILVVQELSNKLRIQQLANLIIAERPEEIKAREPQLPQSTESCTVRSLSNKSTEKILAGRVAVRSLRSTVASQYLQY